MANKRRWRSLAIGLGMALTLAFPAAASAAPASGTGEVLATTRIQKEHEPTMCLTATIRDGHAIPRYGAVQQPCAGSAEPTQMWEFLSAMPEYYYYFQLRSKHTGLCLYATDFSSGARIGQKPCSTDEPPPRNELWGITTGINHTLVPPLGDDVLVITVSASTGTRLENRRGPDNADQEFLFPDGTPHPID